MLPAFSPVTFDIPDVPPVAIDIPDVPPVTFDILDVPPVAFDIPDVHRMSHSNHPGAEYKRPYNHPRTTECGCIHGNM